MDPDEEGKEGAVQAPGTDEPASGCETTATYCMVIIAIGAIIVAGLLLQIVVPAAPCGALLVLVGTGLIGALITSCLQKLIKKRMTKRSTRQP